MHLWVYIPVSWFLGRRVVIFCYLGRQVFCRFADGLYANGECLPCYTPHCFTYHILCPQRHLFMTELLVSTWRPLSTWLRPAVYRTTWHRVAATSQMLSQIKETFVLVLYLLAGLRRDVVRSCAFCLSFHTHSYCLRAYVLQPKKWSVLFMVKHAQITDHVP